MSKKILSIEASNGDAFTDLLFNALLGFAFMFFISFALIQKPQDGGKIDSKAEFIISAEWEDHHPDDIDLIVEDPQGNIVYFQRQQAGLMHLDRDDRGTLADRIVIDGVEMENPANQEVVTIRGYMKGEYVVNLLYYKSNFITPLKVKVKVEKINTLVVRGKLKSFKGSLGYKKDFKKAIITLAEGNTIDSSLEIK